MADVDSDFDRIVASVDMLEACAVEHEAKSQDKGFCHENRSFLAAMAITHLGLTVDDIGNIARHLIEMEIADECSECQRDAETDETLNATELKLI